MSENSEAYPSIDVRTLPPHERHPRIFAMLDALTPKTSMLLTSDHDPVPLRRHLDMLYSGAFEWSYLEQGPDVWRVEIQRLDHSGCTCDGG